MTDQLPSFHLRRAALPAALLLSLVAHAVMVALAVKTWQDSRPATIVGRAKGALQVTLRRDTTPAAKPAAPAVERNTNNSAPRKQRARAERPAAQPKPAPAPPVAAASPPPPEARPGARFASLFAPIVHAPIGQGGWSSNRQRHLPPPLPTEQQRAQALAALRASLQSRLLSLADQLRATQAQVACDLVVDVERRIGQLECEDAQQLSIAWAHLHGTLMGGLVSEAAQRLCLRLMGEQVVDATCASPATP